MRAAWRSCAPALLAHLGGPSVVSLCQIYLEIRLLSRVQTHTERLRGAASCGLGGPVHWHWRWFWRTMAYVARRRPPLTICIPAPARQIASSKNIYLVPKDQQPPSHLDAICNLPPPRRRPNANILYCCLSLDPEMNEADTNSFRVCGSEPRHRRQSRSRSPAPLVVRTYCASRGSTSLLASPPPLMLIAAVRK